MVWFTGSKLSRENSRRHRGGLAVAFALSITLALAGCGGGGESGGGGKTSSGGGKSGSSGQSAGGGKATESGKRDFVVVGVPRDAKTLDPGMAEDFESGQINELLYETLIRFNKETLALEPCLATEWNVSEDGKTWTFQLREGVKFHNGDDLDADAVLFSFERQFYPDHPHHRIGRMPYAEAFYLSTLAYETANETSYKAGVASNPPKYYREIALPNGGKEYRRYKLSKSDDGKSVSFELKAPFVSFGANLACDASSIVSPAALEEHGVDFESNPAGAGAFKLKNWTKGSEIALERFDGYWDEEGAAATPTLYFRVYEEASQRYNALKTDEAQLITSVDPEFIEQIESDDNLKLYREAALSISYLEMNHEKAPMKNRKFRQALNYAVDRESLVEIQMNGVGYVSRGALPPNMEGALSEPVYGYDPEKAKQLLAESGVDPDSFVLEFKTYDSTRPYNPIGKRLAEACKQDFENIGLNVKLEVVDFAKYLDDRNAGEFMIGNIGWGSDNGQADNTIFELFGKRDNRMRYQNGEAIRLMRMAMVERDDAKRDDLYRQANQMIVDDAAAVWLNHGMQMVAARKSVEGFKLHPKGTHKFEYVYDER